MLVTLDGIIVAEKVRIRDLGSYAGNWTSDGVLLSVVPACAVMCQSVINLVEAGSLPLPTREDDDHLRLQSIVEHMIDTFEGEPAFAEGVTALVQFRGTHFVINTAGGFDLQSGNAVPSTGGSGGGFESDKGDAGDEAKDENGHDVASLMSDNINALILPEVSIHLFCFHVVCQLKLYCVADTISTHPTNT
ncbi:hypothetical protein BC835DRAFT_645182 [Cytidiella melzeri]|nr:hypothetical protein BC835DRAFT_645182 [Cytidiella melzeri]